MNLDLYLDMHQERLQQSRASYVLEARSQRQASLWQRSANWLRLFLA
jgi:hypothetical protein